MIKYFLLIITAFLLLSSQSLASTITYDKEGKFITISGDIEKDDHKKFAKMISKNKVEVVILESDGGLFIPSVEIAEAIKKNGNISTLVKDKKRCLSACAFIWISGKYRFLYQTSIIGFHAPYNTKTKKGEKLSNLVVAWLIGSQNLSFIMAMDILKIKYNEMMILSQTLATKWGIELILIVKKQATNSSTKSKDKK